MTKIKQSVCRETYGTIFSQGKNRPVVVSVQSPNLLGFRLKGARHTYYLTAEICYMQALKATLSAEKKEKRKLKKKGKKCA